MTSEAVLFAGARISSGRKPVTFAGLNDRLEIIVLTEWDYSEALQCLREYEQVRLAIHSSKTKIGREFFQNFQAMIDEAGFKQYSTEDGPRLWIESNADDCFRVYQPNLFSRQSLVGRLQRALILYDEGLQIPDPMDFFEEITRHKLLQGVLSTENIYSSGQLDALVMAYVSWLADNPSEKVMVRDQYLLPQIIEND
jgi:hypothetical protein